MANSPPSSFQSEPTGSLYSDHEPNLSYTSIYDTSIENTLSLQTNQAPPPSSSIYIDTPLNPSNETPFDLLQGFSAPTLPVYINMGLHEGTDDVSFAGPTTTDQTLSRSLAAIDVDHSLPSSSGQRHSHHHHHFPHHSQNRNRYPYLQRAISSKALSRPSIPSTSAENLYYEQRPAFRRSYFALRRQRIPKAPPMPKHLFPGYRQNRTPTLIHGTDGDDNEAEEEEADQPPSKSLLTILRLVFFFLAIEFMYAVETALTVPILTSLRVPESFYSMAWLISPILGFFLQPIVGMWSDNCKCRWGRRRPFILAFAIGAYIGVALLLNSHDLGVILGDPTEAKTVPYKAVIFTAVGVTLLDFCADSADAPIRAYLIDTTNPSDQERGFNIHAILGFGGGLGFIVGAIDWPYIPVINKNGGEFGVIFIIASFLFIICTITTLTSVREEPLISSSSLLLRDNGDTGNTNDDEQLEIEIDEKRPLLSLRRNSSRSYSTNNKPDRLTSNNYLVDLNSQEGFIEIDPATGRHIPHDQVERTNENILLQTLENSHQLVAASMANLDPSNPGPVPTQAFEAELKQKAKLVKLGLMRRPASEETDDYDEKDSVTIKSMLISMVRMPPRLWKLMICQVIGWIGYFATHLYFTDFIATEVYGGDYDPNDVVRFALYKKGVAMGCWGLFLYSASSAIYAFCLERWLAEKFSLKTLYFVGYFVYALGCVVNYFVHNVVVNIIMCVTFGMLVVSLNTLPYHMLSNFHTDEAYKNKDGTKRGIGVDCSLLNSCYFLGELIVAVSLGPLLERTGVNTCMLVGAVFSLFGNICMCFLFFYKN